MQHLPAPPPEGATDPTEPIVIDLPLELFAPAPLAGPTFSELVEADCYCGNVTARGHGMIPGRRRAFTCDEILAIRANVEAALAPQARWTRRLALLRALLSRRSR